MPIVPTLGEHHRDDLSERLLIEIDRKGTASTGLRQQLALIYERQEKLDQARELLEKSAPAPSQLAPLLVDLARVARKQKDFKGALGYLAHARDVEPKNAKISYLYGLVCLDADLLAEAHQAFSRALSSNPNDPLYNYAMGLVAAYRSDPLEAIPYLQKYRQLKPSDPRGKLALGVAYFNHHDFASARQPLREAAQSSETSVEAHYHLGSIARQEGRVDEAIGELREVLRATPQFADALAELGQCYLQKKDYQTAQEFLDRAVGVDPSNYLANFSLLLLYSRTKDPREKTQAAHFESIKDKRYERRRAMLRTIEVRPSGM
jgi:tetratricopeptide (TPR) repeat protein